MNPGSPGLPCGILVCQVERLTVLGADLVIPFSFFFIFPRAARNTMYNRTHRAASVAFLAIEALCAPRALWEHTLQ